MKAIFLTVAAACLAVPSHAVGVQVVGDETSGIFTKIIPNVPAVASDAGVYSADIGDPIFYDAQARRQTTRRNQQGSYLEQPNRYQTDNRFTAGTKNSISGQRWQPSQAGVKYDSFGRPIQTFGNQLNKPSSIYQNRVIAGQGGSVAVNQFGQHPAGSSQGNHLSIRPTGTFGGQNAVGFGSFASQTTGISPIVKPINQQFGFSRPITGQQFPNQFATQQTAGQFSGHQTAGQFPISPTGSQFGQQFGRPSTSQFGQSGFGQSGIGQFGQLPTNQFGQQSSSQFGQPGISQFGQQPVSQFGQQITSQFGQPVNSQFGQQPATQFGQQVSNQFGQQTSTPFGQRVVNQFGQQSGSQFGQHPLTQFGQQPSTQFGQQPSTQFGQQASTQFGQQPLPQFGQQPSSQFGQQTGGQFGQQIGSQFGQQSGFQSGIRTVGNQFSRIPNQQLNSITGDTFRGNDIDSQRTTGSLG